MNNVAETTRSNALANATSYALPMLLAINTFALLALDRLGYHVFAGVRKAEDGRSLRSAGTSRLTPVTLDVTDAGTITAAVEQVRAAAGSSGLAGAAVHADTAARFDR